MNADKVTSKLESSDISQNDEIGNASGIQLQQEKSALARMNRSADQEKVIGPIVQLQLIIANSNLFLNPFF